MMEKFPDSRFTVLTEQLEVFLSNTSNCLKLILENSLYLTRLRRTEEGIPRHREVRSEWIYHVCPAHLPPGHTLHEVLEDIPFTWALRTH